MFDPVLRMFHPSIYEARQAPKIFGPFAASNSSRLSSRTLDILHNVDPTRQFCRIRGCTLGIRSYGLPLFSQL